MRRAIGVFLCCAAAWCQNAPAPEFEVAAIKPSAAQEGAAQIHVGVQLDGSQLHCSYLSLKDYIAMAYRVKQHQLTGPDWLGSERFDIAAKIPEGARDKVAEMMQRLLETRFELKMHRDSKEFPVYALTVAKGGLKLKESPLDAEGEGSGGPGAVNVSASGGRAGVSVNLGRGASFTFANNRFEAKKVTMLALADSLARYMDRPVVDMTGLTSTYDLALELSPEDARAMTIRSALAAGVALPPEAMRALEGVSDASLFSGMQALGLRLEARKAPLPVLVVDHVLRTPTDN
jgi:uncharacterized protein (TIGR03435 family)